MTSEIAKKLSTTNGTTGKSLTLTFFNKDEDAIKDGVYTIADKHYKKLNHPEWAPTWDPKHEGAFKHLPAFKHLDRGYFGDPSFENLFADKSVQSKPISPKLGTEITGLQLHELTDRQKDDLALFVEQRGVVVFRDQEFKNQSFDEIKNFGKYFGPLHVHATSGSPLNQPEFHIVFRKGEKGEQSKVFANRLNSIAWHSDTTYEPQPPGITLLGMLQTSIGGDTQFLDAIEAYDRLSPTFKDLIDGLKVVHTSTDQAAHAKLAGGIERKVPVDSIHPLVRYHPVLKKKSLYVTGQFDRRILGMKQEESDAILKFLYNHIKTLLDAHIRANWDDKTVVVWDNRRVFHAATLDWDTDELRHAFRLTSLAERPVGSEQEFNDYDVEEDDKYRAQFDEIASLTPAEYYEQFGSKK